MIQLFFDIETIPWSESLRSEIETTIAPPKNFVNPERINKWMIEEKPGEIETRFRKTSLRAHTGKILCIGYIKEDGDHRDEGVLTGPETKILQEFWELSKDVQEFIGFNVIEFDLKYIWQRSVILNIPPTKELLSTGKLTHSVFDVMQEWDMWSARDHISLDTLSKTLGVTSPKAGGINGALVYDYFIEGRCQEIYDYCLRDVVATREIYLKLTFRP